VNIRRATKTLLLTGEKLELVKQFKPFVDSQAVDIIHPDIAFAGGITGIRKIADYAALNRTPVALHNIGSLVGPTPRFSWPPGFRTSTVPKPVWAGPGASTNRWPPTIRR